MSLKSIIIPNETYKKIASDPYVCVCIAPGTTFITTKSSDLNWKKTPVKSNTLTPKWDSKNEFEFAVSNPEIEKLWFMVYDKDLIGSDEKLGGSFTSLLDLKSGQKQSRVLKLSGGVNKKNQGQLFIELEISGGDSK